MSECTGHCNGDAVPIKVNRVFDSCSDKDCISNVPVTLTTELPVSVTIVKSRCVTVADVCINVEEIPFNKGFYLKSSTNLILSSTFVDPVNL